MRHRLDRRDADAAGDQHRSMRCLGEREERPRHRGVEPQAEPEVLVHGQGAAASLGLALHGDLVGIGAMRTGRDRVAPGRGGAIGQAHGQVEVGAGDHRRQRRAVGGPQLEGPHRWRELAHAGDRQRERPVAERWRRHWRRRRLRSGQRRLGVAQLRLQLLHLRAQRGGERRDLGLGETRRDVLRTVPVPTLDADQEGALDRRAVGRIAHRGDGRVALRADAGLDQLHAPEQLQPAPIRIVHDDHREAVVLAQVADAQVLHIAAEVREADGPRIQHLEETLRPAAVLHVGPAGLADRGLEEVVGLGEELRLAGRQRLAAVAHRVEEGVLLAAAFLRLDLADRRGEGDVRIGASHDELPVRMRTFRPRSAVRA